MMYCFCFSVMHTLQEHFEAIVSQGMIGSIRPQHGLNFFFTVMASVRICFGAAAGVAASALGFVHRFVSSGKQRFS